MKDISVLKVSAIGFAVYFVPMVILLSLANIGSGGSYGWPTVFIASGGAGLACALVTAFIGLLLE